MNTGQNFKPKNKLFKTFKVLILLLVFSQSFYVIATSAYAMKQKPNAPIEETKTIETPKPQSFKEFERIDLRTPYAKVFQTGNNTFRYEVTADKIHYGSQGNYKEINNNIIQENIGKFKYRNAGNDFIFRSGETIEEGVEYKKGSLICEFKLSNISDIQTLNKSSAVIKNNIITYPNIYPNADLEFTVLSSGIKTEIVAKDQSALKSQIEFELTNCDPKTFNTPIVATSTKSAIINQQIVENQINSLQKSNNSKKLILKPDYSKLGNIKGEVRIDPSILVSENVFVSNACTGNWRRFIATGDWTDSQNSQPCGRTEAYLKFNFSLPSNAIVNTAELSLKKYQTDFGGFNVSVGRLTTNGLNTDTGSTLGDFQPRTGAYDTKYINPGNIYTEGFYDFRLDVKNLVNEWRNGTYPNYGLAVFGDSPAGSWRGAAFCSTRNDGFCNPEQNPTIEIDYFTNNPPNTPNNPSPTSGSVFSGNCDESTFPITGNCRTTTNLNITVNNIGDADPSPGNLQKTVMTFTDANNFSTPDLIGSGNVTYNHNFFDGKTRWGARSYDNMGVSSGFAGFYEFTTDTTPSSIPGINALPQYTRSVGTDALQVQVVGQMSNDNVSPQGGISYQLEYSRNPNFIGSVFYSGWQQNNPVFNLTPKGADGVAGGPDDIVPYNTFYFKIKSRDSQNNISNWSSAVQTTVYDNNPPYTPNPILPVNGTEISGFCDESASPSTGNCRTTTNVNFRLSGIGDGDLPPGDFDKTYIDFFESQASSTVIQSSDPINGTGTVNWNKNFSDNKYYWSAHSVDKLGEWGNYSPRFNFQVDTTPPVLPTSQPLPEFTPGVGVDATVQVEFFGNKTTDNVSAQNKISYELQYSKLQDFSNPTQIFSKLWQLDNPRFEIGPKGVDGIAGTADDITDGNTYYFRFKARDELGNISAWNYKDSNGHILKTTIDGVKPVINEFKASDIRFSPENPTSTGYKDSVNFETTYTELNPKTATLNIYSSTDSTRSNPLRSIAQDLTTTPGNATGNANQYKFSLNWDGKDNGNNFLADGYYAGVLTIVDKATNQTKSSELIIIVDNSSANITISSPTNEFWTNQNEINIKGQATAPNLPDAEDGDLEKLEIKKTAETIWNNITFVLGNPDDVNLGIFDHVLNLNLGKNSYEIRSTDTVGNQESIQHSINHETTPPVVSNVLPSGLTNNRKPIITYSVTDPDPTSDGSQRSDLRTGINSLNTRIWLTYPVYNAQNNNYEQQTKILIDNGVNLDPALVSNLNCVAAIGAQTSIKNGVNVASSINCSLAFIADLQPDSTYTIHIQTKDIAGNETIKEDTSFILDSHIYSELIAPNNGSTYSTSSVLFKGKSSKNSNITIRNQQLNREKTFLLNESLNNSGQDNISDPNRLIASNFVVTCGEFKDIDSRADTKDEELCNWEVRIYQIYQNINAVFPNTNIITLKDEATNTVVHTSNFNINLYAFDVEINSDLNYFSPNGDGNQDSIKFTHTATNPTDQTAPPLIANYKLQITNSSGTIVREFNGTNNLPIDTFWDGKKCDPAASTTNCEYVADGEYKFSLSVTTTDGITITTTPQSIFAKTVLLDEVIITNPKDGAVTTNGVITVQGQAPKPQNTEGSVNPLRGKVYVDICIDTIGTTESCDITTTVETDINGFFSSLIILPRLNQTQTLHNITAKARDSFGNSTKNSNTVQIIQDTLDPFKRIQITPVLTGINTEEDYRKFLNGEIGIDKLRVLRLTAELTQNTEGLQYSFAEYVNVNQRPDNPNFRYISTVNNIKEDNLNNNPYNLESIKKNHNKPLGDPNIPAANCSSTSCLWEYYLPAQPNWGGIYEVEFKAKKGDTVQSLTAGFKADGNIPAAPIIMIVERWDEATNTWVTVTPYESKYYTNKTKIRLRGAAEPNINLQFSANNIQLPAFKSSNLGIWEKEIDYGTLVNNFCKQYVNGICGLADLNFTLIAYKTDSNGNPTYQIPSVNNAFVTYDSIAPQATSITRITPEGTINGWAQTGMPVQYTSNANEKLIYADIIGEDGFVRLLTNSSQNTWLGVINANRNTEGYYNPQLRMMDLAGNISLYKSSDPVFLQPNSIIKDWRIYIDNTKPEGSIIDKSGWGIDNGIHADGILPEEGRLNPEYVVKANKVTIKGKAEKDQRVEIYVNNKVHKTINVGNNGCETVTNYERRITNDGLIVKDNIVCEYSYDYVFPGNGLDDLFGAPRESYIFQVKVLDKAANYSAISKQEIVYHDKKQPLKPQILSVNVKPITQNLDFTVSIRSERFADIQYWYYGPNGNELEYRLLKNTSLGLLDQKFKMGSRRDDLDPACMKMIGLRRTGICQDGIYTLKIKATDAAGNATDLTVLQIERDTVAPKTPEIINVNRKSPTKELDVTIKTLAEERTTINYRNSSLSNMVLRNRNFYREFMNSDNGYSDQLFQLGTNRDENNPQCIWVWDFRRIGICEDGMYFFSLTATDAAGNTSDAASTRLERDTVNPMQPKIIYKSAEVITKELVYRVTTQTEKNSIVFYNFLPPTTSAQAPNVRWERRNSTEISQEYKLGTKRDDSDDKCMKMEGTRRVGICEDGIYSWLIQSGDDAGNVSIQTDIKLERDTVNPLKPKVEIIVDKSNHKLNAKITGEANTKAFIKLLSSNTNKTFEFTLDQTGALVVNDLVGLYLPKTKYTLEVTLTDSAANVSESGMHSVTTPEDGFCFGGSGNILYAPLKGNYVPSAEGGFYAPRFYGEHGAQDFTYNVGEPSFDKPVYAAEYGEVITATQGNFWYDIPLNEQFNGVSGRFPSATQVTIRHSGKGLLTEYLHLNQRLVNKTTDTGEPYMIQAGQQLGTLGNSGYVEPRPTYVGDPSGAHLHFAVGVINAEAYKHYDRVTVFGIEYIDPIAVIGVECVGKQGRGAGADLPNYGKDSINRSEAEDAVATFVRDNLQDISQLESNKEGRRVYKMKGELGDSKNDINKIKENLDVFQLECGVWMQNLGKILESGDASIWAQSDDGAIFVNPIDKKAYLVRGEIWNKYYNSGGGCSEIGVPKSAQGKAGVRSISRFEGRNITDAMYQRFQTKKYENNSIYWYKTEWREDSGCLFIWCHKREDKFAQRAHYVIGETANTYEKIHGTWSNLAFPVNDTNSGEQNFEQGEIREGNKIYGIRHDSIKTDGSEDEKLIETGIYYLCDSGEIPNFSADDVNKDQVCESLKKHISGKEFYDFSLQKDSIPDIETYAAGYYEKDNRIYINQIFRTTNIDYVGTLLIHEGQHANWTKRKRGEKGVTELDDEFNAFKLHGQFLQHIHLDRYDDNSLPEPADKLMSSYLGSGLFKLEGSFGNFYYKLEEDRVIYKTVCSIYYPILKSQDQKRCENDYDYGK